MGPGPAFPGLPPRRRCPPGLGPSDEALRPGALPRPSRFRSPPPFPVLPPRALRPAPHAAGGAGGRGAVNGANGGR